MKPIALSKMPVFSRPQNIAFAAEAILRNAHNVKAVVFPMQPDLPLHADRVSRAMLAHVDRCLEKLQFISKETGIPVRSLLHHPFGALWAHDLTPSSTQALNPRSWLGLFSVMRQLHDDHLSKVYWPGFEEGTCVSGYYHSDMVGIRSVDQYACYLRNGSLAKRAFFDETQNQRVYSSPIPETALALKVTAGLHEAAFGIDFFIAHRDNVLAYDSEWPVLAKVGVRLFPNHAEIVTIHPGEKPACVTESMAFLSPLSDEATETEQQIALSKVLAEMNKFDWLLRVTMLWANCLGLPLLIGLPSHGHHWMAIKGFDMHAFLDERFSHAGFMRGRRTDSNYISNIGLVSQGELCRRLFGGNTSLFAFTQEVLNLLRLEDEELPMGQPVLANELFQELKGSLSG